MKKNIAVIGAGMGGLQAAYTLAKAGCDVTVYEKSDREHLCHDQIDVCEVKLFTDLDIPVPEGSKKSTPCYFVGPNTDKSILLNINEDDRDWSIERRTFGKERTAACEEAGVKFEFGKAVDSLIFEKDAVKGIKIGKKEVLADLVIDASGCNSPFRAEFNGKGGITAKPGSDEIFNVFHSYYEPREGIEYDDKYKFYLKYMGKPGICWCGMEFDGSISTLIGNIGDLTEESYEESFAQLKKDNPIIGDKLIRGGFATSIPVRYPAPIMVSEGYATVGDSAFMTIPLLGNGIANAIRGGQMLAEAIIDDGSVSIYTLWKYQVNYFKKIGALCCFVDFIKRGLISTDNDELTYLFESEIITDEDVDAIFSGHLPNIKPDVIIQKFKKAAKAHGFFGTMLSSALKGAEAMRVAQKIPEDYDVSKVFAWKFKLDSLYKKN